MSLRRYEANWGSFVIGASKLLPSKLFENFKNDEKLFCSGSKNEFCFAQLSNKFQREGNERGKNLLVKKTFLNLP